MSRQAASARPSRLDEEYPALVPRRPANPPPAQPPAPPPPAPVAPPRNPPPPAGTTLTAAQQYDLFGITSVDSFLQTDFSRQDFGLALSSTIGFIPDPPYDFREPPPDADGPPVYPQFPNLKLLQPEFFRRFDLPTLFYIFFYCPATTRQYWAGEELKRRDWKFHRRYETWFHRLTEPTEKTPEYEVAKFEYFDHSTREGWCMRVSNNFKFEYEHMGE
jgi:CCR4-NOT transcription complex subunit 3